MWQIAGYSALTVAVICLIVLSVRPVSQSSSMSNNSPTIGHSFEVLNDGDEDGQTLEELRRIARSCQSKFPKPPMSEIRKDLEVLAENLHKAKDYQN